jgi:hypothetical protein
MKETSVNRGGGAHILNAANGNRQVSMEIYSDLRPAGRPGRTRALPLASAGRWADVGLTEIDAGQAVGFSVITLIVFLSNMSFSCLINICPRLAKGIMITIRTSTKLQEGVL